MKKNIVLAITAILLTGCMGSGSTSQVKEDNNGLIIFEQPEKVIETKSFKVFQVLDKGYALANSSCRASDERDLSFQKFHIHCFKGLILIC